MENNNDLLPIIKDESNVFLLKNQKRYWAMIYLKEKRRNGEKDVIISAINNFQDRGSKDLVEKIERGIPVSWNIIQENSVQLWMNKIEKLKLPEIRGCEQDGVYSWIDRYEYDAEFLGIMGGILNPETFFTETGGVF